MRPTIVIAEPDRQKLPMRGPGCKASRYASRRKHKIALAKLSAMPVGFEEAFAFDGPEQQMTHPRAGPIKAAPHLTDTHDAKPNAPQCLGAGIRECQKPIPTSAWDTNSSIAVRYGSREVECPSCGRFKMSESLFIEAPLLLAADSESAQRLATFVRARNGEGKTPFLTDDNWRQLAADS